MSPKNHKITTKELQELRNAINDSLVVIDSSLNLKRSDVLQIAQKKGNIGISAEDLNYWWTRIANPK